MAAGFLRSTGERAGRARSSPARPGFVRRSLNGPGTHRGKVVPSRDSYPGFGWQTRSYPWSKLWVGSLPCHRSIAKEFPPVFNRGRPDGGCASERI